MPRKTYTKRCTRPGCGRTFTTTRPSQYLCSRACARALQADRLRGKLHPALAANQEARRERLRDRLRDTFGELSTREIAIFRWAWSTASGLAYHRGQATVRRELRVQEARMAAEQHAAADAHSLTGAFA